MPSPNDKRRVCVAQIGAAHGVRGEMRLKSFTADPGAVTRYGPLESEDGARRFEISSARPAGEVLIVRVKGVEDRNAAEALRSLRLYVPRERLADPDEDEFYHADLVGLAVLDGEGRALGTVVAVQNFGAGDMLEIAPAQGASFFVPFTRAAVPAVDLDAGTATVVPPPESLE